MDKKTYSYTHLRTIFDKVTRMFTTIFNDSPIFEKTNDVVIILKLVRDNKLVGGSLPNTQLAVRNCLSHQRKIDDATLKKYVKEVVEFFEEQQELMSEKEKQNMKKYLNVAEKVIIV